MVILFFIAIVVLVMLGARHRNRIAPPLSLPPPDERSPSALAADDPVEALLRYGSPEDAARLNEQGVDLGELGYRPPRDE